MTVFLLSYLCIYSLLHYYVLRRLSPHIGPAGSWVLVLFMMAMVLSPILIRIAERKGMTFGLHPLAHVTYGWMGLLFLFVSICALVDAVRLICILAGHCSSLSVPVPSARDARMLYGVIALTLTLYVYGLLAAARPVLEHVVVHSDKIPAEVGRIRIVQISDLHLGLLVGKRQLGRILAMVETARPDLLVSTGDMVDGQPDGLREEAALLAGMRPPLGKIAVTGNHEFYAGLGNSLAFIRAAGFIILRHRALTRGPLVVVGVDDRAGKWYHHQPPVSETDLLSSLPGNRFVLLLKHRPDIDPGSLGLFDLQLSGHTHKGQIFPFNLVAWLFYPYPAGSLTRLSRGFLYLSRGTATWGPPVRIFAPPEVTVIDLVSAG